VGPTIDNTPTKLIYFLVVNGKNQVQTFARRFLDPRRPKDKLTVQEKEEGLVQYDALLPDDSRRIVSHGYPLFADSLLTTPTQLESTSLVLAYGLDLFVTRVAPSGSFDVLSEEFNKIQLVLTVLGLGVAILITRPLVSAKIRKAKWYY
jgi:ER membrane protein complex subunit 1